jgi:sialate O-acetylesterase
MITIHNVMIGEVWLASGQSNMAMTVDSINKNIRGVTNYKQKIAEANFTSIRMFTVQHKLDSIPQEDCSGKWQVCNPDNVRKFSATGYFFAKTLVDSLNIPVGIIHSSWGGSEVESWMKKELVTENKRLYEGYKNLIGNKIASTPPGLKYNAMIYPLENYTIKGVVWYQGERNKPNASVYTELMTQLITSWRNSRGYEFPFYLVQIVPYTQRNVSSTYLRDAQRQILFLSKTGMVVTSDFSELNNLHPPQKEEVGRRLALWALAKDYGKNIVCSGPLYKSMKIKDNTIEIEFDYAQGGLMVKNGTLNNFEIAGKDHIYVPAVAKIKGSTVIAYSDNIKKPVAVRYAFSDNIQSHIINQSGLPASIFRTDTISKSIQ